MRRVRRAGYALALLAAAAVAAPPAATAQDAPQPASGAEAPVPPQQPFLLQADEIIYDEQLGSVTASGNIEISNGERVLLADRVTYNMRDRVVTASGNISLREPSGDYVFAEYMQLDEELQSGFVESIRILMTDDSRFAANEAQRLPDGDTILSRAVYSPCELCPEAEAPLWQLKAVRVVHDREQQQVSYRDATLEVMGTPVFWLPYFSHPDPTVERQSGFLSPTFGSSSDLGFMTQVPYYFNIAPNRDATFAPIYTSEEGVVATGEYRALTETGGYQFSGSATLDDRDDEFGGGLDDAEFRGHIFGEGKFDIDDERHWGFALQRSSDDTYLKRYRFSDEDTLTSNLFVERLDGRNYAAANAYAFQGLRAEDDPGATPFVAPLLDYSWVSDPSGYGGWFEVNANAVSLYRTEGTDTRRATLLGSWQYPYVAPAGHVSTVIAQLRGDAYWLNDVTHPEDPDAPGDDGFEGRLRPLLAVDWRYPFVRPEGTFQEVVEPIAQLIVTPYGGNPPDIPNEDSLSFDFDDTNLFSLNRFPGYDRYESGPRLNYGVKLSAYGQRGGYATGMIGQVLRLEDEDIFASSSGLEETGSDYVARVTIVPSPYFDLTNRVRLDRNDLSLRRNEIYFSAGPRYLRLSASYVQLDREITVDGLESREELYLAAQTKLTPYWTATAAGRRDLTDGGRQIRTTFSLGYEDECIGFILVFDRDFTRDREVEPSTSVQFRILLKTLS